MHRNKTTKHINLALRWFFGLAIGLAFCAAGLGVTHPVLAAPHKQGTNFTLETLQNAEYRTQSLPTRTVQLTDGVYEEFGANGAASVRIALTDQYVFGDLNGDGVNDAAAILVTSTPQSDSLLELVALINEEGTPAIGGLILLGERVRINSLSIVNGEILVDLSRYLPGDEECCPSKDSTNVYYSRLGMLVPKQTRSFGQLFPFQDGTLYGYVNVLGEMVIEPQFVLAGEFSEGMAPVSYDGKSTGYINQLGELVIDPKFSYGGSFVGGTALVGLPGVDADAPFVTAYIDRVGRLLFGEAFFHSAEPFSEGLAAVSYDGVQYGYLDLSGQVAIEPQFSRAEPFSEGLAPVEFAGRYGFIDHSGNFVIEPQFEAAEPFHNGLAQVMLGGKTGYINHRGDIVIEPVFDYGNDFHGGRALVALEGQPLYIDEAGNGAFELPGLSGGQDFSEGLAAVAVEGRYGYIDVHGNVVVAPQYNTATAFKGGLAVVQTDEIWMVINSIGEIVLELPKFVRSEDRATEVVAYVPALPRETRNGVCNANSQVLSVSGAWRCTVDNQEFDPCLVGEDGATLVCDANPSLNGAGFGVNLTKPLPEVANKALTQTVVALWEMRLDDSSTCTLVAGLNLTVEGKPVTYVCSDGEVLLGDIDRSGAIWSVDKALLANDDQGNFTITERNQVGILTAWQLAEPQE